MTIWTIGLVLAVVVVGVVGLMLFLINRQARIIMGGTSAICDVGQCIANNTIHLSALIQTNTIVQKILNGVPPLLDDLGRIHSHAKCCSGCPGCIG